MTALQSFSIDKGRTFVVGQNYKLNNGNTITVKSIWCDRDGIDIGYEFDGQPGNSTPNNLYWQVDWKAPLAKT